ncbi:MAG: CZB domain-containing protein [Planctomycetota bacterium]
MSSQLVDQIAAAIGAHGLWKGRLLAAIESGKSDTDVATVKRDDACKFGTWLHTEIDPTAKSSPHFAKVKEQHAKFHQEAARILGMALSGDKAGAKGALSGTYTKVSNELINLLRDWRGA